jgi:uracil-DNA glycosylase family protein
VSTTMRADEAGTSTSTASIPADASLTRLRELAADCTACDLHRTGTQTVFGEGAADAAVVLVGEQPGDLEDEEGHPFVGPAGRELDRALAEVGLGATPQYRTNVVKHFKWHERRGKRRIHETPTAIEVRSCLPWLHAELARTDPEVLVVLGATAVSALLGRDVQVTRVRGRFLLGPSGRLTLATVHPASVLRARTDRERSEAREAFQADLAKVAGVVHDGLEVGLEAATVEELRELARDLELTGVSHLRKADLAAEEADGLASRRAG